MKKKFVFIFIFLLLLIFIIYIFVILSPSHSKNWESGFEKLPQIQVKENTVTIHNVRNNSWDNNTYNQEYINRTLDLNSLEKTWIVVEPFTIEPFTSFNGSAHTYFVFDFKNSSPIAVSVEARREKGETYNAFLGTFNKYELIYIWGTEKDISGNRVIKQNNKLYMYPLTISNKAQKKLFMQLVKSTKDLESKPRFYNSLTSNCTNELAKNANSVKKNAIPFSLALILPGYTPELLYDLHYIPTTKPLKEITEKYYISDVVKKYYKSSNLSKNIRTFLLNK